MRRHYESIRSTNEAAVSWARDESTPAPHGAIVTADAQTHGHGRRGRDWASPPGKGVYLSVVWRPEIAVADVGQLTMITAFAAASTIEKISSLSVSTKWPNDVLLNGKKIGGVLCETGLEKDRIAFVVAGVGLNINFTAAEFPERPIFPATSLAIETGKCFDVESAREVLVTCLQHEYSRYGDGEWNTQRGEFIAQCSILGEPVRVQNENGEYSGVAVGIDHNGLLVVQNENGLRTVAAGDVFTF